MNDKYFEINVLALLEDLGLADLPDEEKKKFAALVQSNILAKLQFHLESLVETDEEREKLNQATDHPDVLIEYFAEKKDVNFPALIAQFTHEVREELLQDVAYIRGSIMGKQQADEPSTES